MESKAACDLLKNKNIRLDRELFLSKLLKPYVTSSILEKALQTTPKQAGISATLMEELALKCMKRHAYKAASLAIISGVAPGKSMVPCLIVEGISYEINMLQLVQELLYLYGARNLLDSEEEQLELLLWMMLGSNIAITIFKDGTLLGVKAALKNHKQVKYTRLITMLLNAYLAYHATIEYGKELKDQLDKTSYKNNSYLLSDSIKTANRTSELQCYLKQGYISQSEYDYYCNREIIYE
ncbi:MAG: hypothetical protein RSA96_03960 [Erysipelotrichaceae bacterium]